MFRINRVTSDPLQKHTIILPNGLTMSFELYFRPMQYGWFLNNVTYQDFVVKGLRVTNFPNLLFQFQNIIPFGLGCFSTENREPQLQEDFSSGASRLFVLDESEVQYYSELIRNG